MSPMAAKHEITATIREMEPTFKNKAMEVNIKDYFKEEFFLTKKIVYLPF